MSRTTTKKPIKAQSKERITVMLSSDIVERLRDVVYWERLTLGQFVEDSLASALQKLEKQKKEPYPKRKAALKPGRPLR